MKSRSSSYRQNLRTRLSIESLEPRTLLDGDGLAVANDAYLTISFADDGVEVAGQSSSLSDFDLLADEEVWKGEILRAFQTWAVHTNADIGLRDDGGQAFGVPGATFDDARFGDIRIGAIALDPSIGAVSVPVDSVVGGTWTGDVLFNTSFAFQSLADLYAIALHEAGNVFGLEDNDDPNSPLHAGAIPTATEPTAADVLALQSLFGRRHPDSNEANNEGGENETNNDTFTNATELELGEGVSDIDGSIPSLVYGDITTLADKDYYLLETSDDYTGPLTFSVRSTGISLLTPRLRVYGSNQTLIQEETSSESAGGQLSITLPVTAVDSDYYVVVDAAPSSQLVMGGYSLTTSYDAINTIDTATLEGYADGSLRKLTGEQILKVLDPDGDDFYDDDLGQDDDFANAATIEVDTAFEVGGRFERTGSITASTDRDFYKIESPASFSGASGVLSVAVRSTTAGGLIPRISILDEDGDAIPATTILNGGGEVVVQATGVAPGKEYVFAIEADKPGGPFSTGNYQVTASFQDAPTSLETFATGTLAVGAFGNLHTFYVAQPQLFHFTLGVPTVGVGLGAVIATVRDSAGGAVHQVATPLGETRSQGAVLLAPGEYTVEVNAVSLYEPILIPIDYELRGLAISDPFAGDPDDPSNHPFACTEPELAGFFCYPGNFVSADPFLWEDFVGNLTDDPPPLDLGGLVDLLLGDWWSWVWEQIGINGPTLAQDDRFDVTVSSGAASFALATAPFNVLANDIDPEGGPVVAVLVTGPTNGTLVLDPDGTATYTPDPGFVGTDRFTYIAYDFVQESTTATARIVVGSGLAGDYDANGVVSATDLDAWRSSYGSTAELLADGNRDGVVDAADYTLLRDLMDAVVTVAVGDYDRNGLVDEGDRDIWAASYGSTSDLAADGNDDGVIDAADYAVWRDALTASPASISQSTIVDESGTTGSTDSLVAGTAIPTTLPPAGERSERARRPRYRPALRPSEHDVALMLLLAEQDQPDANEADLIRHGRAEEAAFDRGQYVPQTRDSMHVNLSNQVARRWHSF